MKVDLTTRIGNLTFKNPVTVASGTFGSKDEYARFFSYDKLGAVITKTVTRKPRLGNPMPRICETPSGMLNAIGLQNKGIDDFLSEKIPYFRKIKTHLIVNIAGESIDDFVYLAKRLDEAGGVSALELNLSCPNVEKGLEFCSVPAIASELVGAVKSETKLPVFAKVSPEARDFLGVVDALIKAGVSALTVMNTIRGMAVDIEKMRPKIANVLGGLSGPAIRPVALRYVYEVKSHFQIPVIAAGGIQTAQDALEFLITGADLVAVGTANFVNPRAAVHVLEGIEKFLKERDFASISDIRGKLRTKETHNLGVTAG